jgi:hypothetical protein
MRKNLGIAGMVILVLSIIPMALTFAAPLKGEGGGGGGNGAGYIFQLDTFNNGNFIGANPGIGNDYLDVIGQVTQTQSGNSVMAVKVICGLPPFDDSGTPQPTATGTPGPIPTPIQCSPENLYIHAVLSVTWSGFIYTYQNMDIYWGTGQDGSHFQELGSKVIPCTVITDIHIGSWGACAVDEYIKLDAADIDWADLSRAQVYFRWDYHDGIGGSGETFIVNYDVTFTGLDPQSLGCEGQFNTGNPIGSFNLASNDSVGVSLQDKFGLGYPAPGEWYKISVTGSWLNNGVGTPLHSIAVKSGSGSYHSISGDGSIGCNSHNNSYYLQMLNTDPVYLRVDDTDGNFASNTGNLQIVISKVTAYNPYPNGCELQYKVGDLIEQGNVNAALVNGWPLNTPNVNWGLGGTAGEKYLSTRYYMLETIGGPANLGTGGLTWDMDIGRRATSQDVIPTAWYGFDTATFIECTNHVDKVGHVKIFFALDEQTNPNQFLTYYYGIRVTDNGSYTDNTGSIGYRLYDAQLLQEQPPGGAVERGCLNYSHDTSPFNTIIVPSSWSNGVSIPNLDNNKLYALLVTGGPWKDNGTNSYNLSISNNNGDTWTDFIDYPDIICYTLNDTYHYLIYVKGATGAEWRVKVRDTDNNYSNNTLSINVDVFNALGNIDLWPKCVDNVNQTEVPLGDETRKIPGNDGGGKLLDKIVKDKSYSILITNESQWFEGGSSTGSYSVEITDDGGVNWIPIEDYGHIACGEKFTDGRIQIYFTAQSNNYKLRVNDGDDNFLSNTGNVYYQLYTTVVLGPNPGPNPGPPGTTPAPEWVTACNERYTRPNSFFTIYDANLISGVTFHIPIPRVGEWLDYLRNSITYFLAWCPSHTEALLNIGNIYTNKEPIATITQLLDMVKYFKDLITTYSSIGGTSDPALISQEPDLFSDSNSIGGGGEGPHIPPSTNPWAIFMIGSANESNSVWYGGKLNMAASLGTSDLTSMASYQTLCQNKFTTLFGIGTPSFCSLISMLRYSKVITWILLGLDIFVVIWLIIYYEPRYLKRFWDLVTGNKNTISKYAGMV